MEIELQGSRKQSEVDEKKRPVQRKIASLDGGEIKIQQCARYRYLRRKTIPNIKM